MKPKKWTPQEYRAWREARAARRRELQFYIDRLKAELAAKDAPGGQPADA
jgi:hypothetical protein